MKDVLFAQKWNSKSMGGVIRTVERHDGLCNTFYSIIILLCSHVCSRQVKILAHLFRSTKNIFVFPFLHFVQYVFFCILFVHNLFDE